MSEFDGTIEHCVLYPRAGSLIQGLYFDITNMPPGAPVIEHPLERDV